MKKLRNSVLLTAAIIITSTMINLPNVAYSVENGSIREYWTLTGFRPENYKIFFDIEDVGRNNCLYNSDHSYAGIEPHDVHEGCLLYTSPSPRDKRQSRMPSSA